VVPAPPPEASSDSSPVLKDLDERALQKLLDASCPKIGSQGVRILHPRVAVKLEEREGEPQDKPAAGSQERKTFLIGCRVCGELVRARYFVAASRSESNPARAKRRKHSICPLGVELSEYYRHLGTCGSLTRSSIP
jgi:hypothetical protein